MPLADRALVVGINNYPGISVLSGAENDAKAFYDWVIDPAGGNVVEPGMAVRILSSDYPNPPSVDVAKPAKEMIDLFFIEIRNAAAANNAAVLGSKAGKRVWLFFSGHGFAPSLDRSGVLMANATPDLVHNIAARAWADRLYEGGWFDEVILFQDACRSRIKDADLNMPFLRPRLAPPGQKPRRFYAFAASNDKLAKEVPLVGGKTHGVFTATLLRALEGAARDPKTDAISVAQLQGYLHDNMKNLLSAADQQNDEISQVPEVLYSEPFDIVAPRPAQPVPAAPVQDFPIRITVRQPGPPARVLDAAFVQVASVDPSPPDWRFRLPRGIYKAAVDGFGESLFQVTGAIGIDGNPGEVNVHV